ncbi:hypothetical protein RF644_08330 [Kocuria sp. CPCC 205258]|uniref:hypothetical protein n=1 Tax=Kocuria sp. CPCC 205258 TaxID=3073552 RepID=UPI0034D50C78
MATTRKKLLQAKRAKRVMFQEQAAGRYLTSGTVRLSSPVKGQGVVAPEVLQRAVTEQRSIDVLRAAMAASETPLSPATAHSVAAQENWWRKIEAEHGWLNSADTAVLLGRSANRSFASAQRSAGKLLAYQRGKTHRYPKFQFDLAKGQVRPVIPELLAVARGYGVPDEDLVLWLCAPTSAFAEQDRPVDHLEDRERLLAAAHDEFGAQW